MDYDLTNIPEGYDRGRDHGPEILSLWIDAIKSHLDGQSVAEILDLGCGTGRFSEILAAGFNAAVLGIDPSQKMLERARAKQRDDRVQYRHGCAESIPLPDQSVDMAFMSMSYHHFHNPRTAAHECRRVLRKQGITVVRTGTREQIPYYAYVPFFPSSRSMLEELMPERAGVQAVFEEAGFELFASEIITQTIAPDWTTYAEKLSAGGDSVLAGLSPEEFQSGLASLRAHAESAKTSAVVEPIDLFLFRLG